jgi:glucose-6-phosphate 1-epimerase
MRRLWQDLPVTELRSPDGACASIADHGAHVLSWKPAGPDAQEALFLSAATGVGDGIALRGGVPVIFPQFAEHGAGRRHGFARVRAWRQQFAGIEAGRAVARYQLTQDDLQQGDCDFRFTLDYEVALQAGELELTLTVTNTDQAKWQFTAALHTYLAVSDLAQVKLHGLQGHAYGDYTDGGAQKNQREEALVIDGEIDRIYTDIDAALQLVDHGRSMTVSQSGFTDAVIWNPGAHKAAALKDLTPGAESRFLCVEAGAVLRPVMLASGATWQARQTFNAY